jgi:type IV pilus assembly protein PilM
MDFLPKTLGTRPRMAVEVRAEGIVAARAEDAAALLTAVGRSELAEGALIPSLRAGNVADKTAVVAAVRKALDAIAGRHGDRSGSGRLRDVTVVVPDSAARVLFLDFDQLPSKAAEALPVVRFRLKKLLPFDADDAVVSYQVMASEKGMVKLLVVAMPKAVLEEYEGVVLGAGYLPGAVLPSTLAALSGLEEISAPALVVNAGLGAVTTAIVQGGMLLLHRSMDMSGDTNGGSGAGIEMLAALPMVDRESSAEESAQQEALGPGGYDRFDAEAAMQTLVIQNAALREVELRTAVREVAQAVSVAVAYFEDTLQVAPGELQTAGALGAETLAAVMEESGFGNLRVREMMDASMMEAGAVTANVPRGWLAGVRGALRN